MVEETIKQYISKLNGKYKFNDLLTFMEDTDITFIDRRLKGPIAIATLDYIVIDVEQLDSYPDMVIYFIFIHEICHMKRMNKYGKEWVLGQLSTTDYETYINHFFYEEILADRYASRLFYRFNQLIYPRSMTQQLDLKSKQKAYEPLISGHYGKIKNENMYREVVQSFIK